MDKETDKTCYTCGYGCARTKANRDRNGWKEWDIDCQKHDNYTCYNDTCENWRDKNDNSKPWF